MSARWVPGPAGRRDPVTRLALIEDELRTHVLGEMGTYKTVELAQRWAQWAHDGQCAPPGDWRIWLIRAGRGFGKTRAGAEWVSQVARDVPGAQIALVGATIEDARRVMVEGPSGLLAVARADEAPVWRQAAGEVHFTSGARAFLFSADCPEKLRGPEHEAAWCDELGKWRGGRGEAAWDNLMLGMRRGELPRVLVTTTPRSTRLMERVRASAGFVETRGRTRDNPHLPARFVEAMAAEYGDTLKGRQELDGEIIDVVPGALWPRALIEARRVRAAPALARVVVGVDPPASEAGDACGIVAVALGADGRGYVIEDASVSGASPERWALAVRDCAERHQAEMVVAEANQGGAMVKSVLVAAGVTVRVKLVHASRGKVARAEPVAALYEGGRAWHVGAFPALEDELRGLQLGGGYQGPGRSPDRADALVWALTMLMLAPRGRPALRNFE